MFFPSREGDWSIADFADAMSAALRALRLERVLLVAVVIVPAGLGPRPLVRALGACSSHVASIAALLAGR